VRAERRRYRERNLEKEKARIRRYELCAKFGLTPEQYDEMYACQGGVCAICHRPETATRGGKPLRLAVDHDHATGKVRSLLCRSCNAALGQMGDSPERLRAAADYLEHHGDQS